mgnify:CR=1 FL=1
MRIFTSDLISLEAEGLLIVLNSMDKASLKQEDFLHYMSILARCPKIRFIVSVDDVSSANLFDDSIYDAFNFMFFKVDTLLEYIDEKQYMKNMFS